MPDVDVTHTHSMCESVFQRDSQGKQIEVEMFLPWQLCCGNIPLSHYSEMKMKKQTSVSNLKSTICHAMCEGNGRGQEGVETRHSLHAPLAMAGLPEEVCESELTSAAKTSDHPSHWYQSKFGRNEPLYIAYCS